MTLPSSRRHVLTLILAAALTAALPGVAAAQRQAAQAPSGAAPAERQARGATVPQSALLADSQNANETRDRLEQLLQKYPPALGQVLKLDPTLLSNADYLAPYPALAAFVAEHPEIQHNPGFFLQNAGRFVLVERELRGRSGILENVLAGLAGLTIFAVVTGTLVWLIRTIIEYRRWNRLSKVQTEVHTKLLDRFTNNDDLMAYMQSSPGRKFLESAPIPLQEEARSIGAPLSRILWSVQAGVVLSLLGLGLLFVSGRVGDEVAQGVFVMAVLAVALGLGFIAAAAVAYGISRRLGLFDRSAQEHA